MIQEIIADHVRSITPMDTLEANHRRETLDWVESGADLFRLQKPAVPPKHLVAYFAIVDPASRKMLLQDHLLAKRWIPPGGHVDPGEDPTQTVQRECVEELGIPAVFLGRPKPHFVTVTQTNGPGQHTDVSLWYLLRASESAPLALEENKFAAVQWWQLDDILRSPIEHFDPHLHRFYKKIHALVA